MKLVQLNCVIPIPPSWCHQTAKNAINAFACKCIQWKGSIVGVLSWEWLLEGEKTFDWGRRANATRHCLYSMCSCTKYYTSFCFNSKKYTVNAPGFVMELKREWKFIMHASRTKVSIRIAILFSRRTLPVMHGTGRSYPQNSWIRCTKL